MNSQVYKSIQKYVKQKQKLFCLLFDPDKLNETQLQKQISIADSCGVDFLFVGSSILTSDRFEKTISFIKATSKIPVVIFPGNTMQISQKADAILFLSLISGRNAEMLIGKHVISAPYIKAAGLEAISTGYILVESGKTTSAMYMSYSLPVPRDKNDIAVCTAMAGEMLGMKMIYLDAGSGAMSHVSEEMIRAVKNNLNIPLIVGGGIKTPEIAYNICQAGADLIVVGNAVEKKSSLIKEISDAVHN